MRKKILFFIDSLHIGGKQRRFLELLLFLKDCSAFDFLIVITEQEIHYKNTIKEIDVPIYVLLRGRWKKNPKLIFKFMKIVRNFDPDIIHCWGLLPTVYAIPAKIIFTKPLISNLISDTKYNFDNSFFSKIMFNYSVIFSDFILGNSKAGLDSYNIFSSKRKLIYNGVRLERFNILESKNLIKKKNNINCFYTIIMVASTKANKNYDLFLDVAKEIYSVRKDVCFIGVGDGDDLNRLKHRISEENIENIYLLGKREDVESLIYISDIGVLFSPSEGISNSIIEYMALRKPVLSTDTLGGTKEIVQENKTGFIMKSDVKSIVNKILFLLADEQLRKNMGKNGRIVIEKKFTIDAMGKQYIKLYNNY